MPVRPTARVKKKGKQGKKSEKLIPPLIQSLTAPAAVAAASASAAELLRLRKSSRASSSFVRRRQTHAKEGERVCECGKREGNARAKKQNCCVSVANFFLSLSSPVPVLKI